MIAYHDQVFRLSTNNSSYLFQITAFGHLEQIYYGALLPADQSILPLALKRTAQIGSSCLYDPSDDLYCLDTLLLEWSGIGKGDYRQSPAEIKMPDGTYTTDFVYQSHRIVSGSLGMDKLPTAYGTVKSCETLEITLLDESNQVTLLMLYTIYPETDVITRRVVLQNHNSKPLTIRKLMSLSWDCPNNAYRLITFDGGWIKEAHKHERRLSYGIHVNASTTGASSNRHNAGFILAAEHAGENHGNVYGFNLLYSGNHSGSVELSNHDLVRVQLGINPYCFEWELAEGESFEAPEAVLSFSQNGLNGLSHHFHDFINEHIIRSDWKGRERPILINTWESFFFKFTSGKLLKLARRAKKVGIELFVLDDGWFGERNNDTAGLGDYRVNRKKLPQGLAAFSKQLHKMGMQFGLWFEPEMVNENSDLFRAHPEYALQTKGKKPARGRNQLVLDLCNPAVRDYIVTHVTHILDTCEVDYVKWDYNRHISDACSPHLQQQGRFFHSYMLGLYEILDRIFTPRPHILFESCSSGGNRFDLGMLCYSPQIWTSDNTDPTERLYIQGGLSYLYPLSTMGAHVSEAPHQQTLRDTPLSTRFHVSVFGCLGYELDLQLLTYVQRKEVKDQITYYKQYRSLLQYGTFWRGEPCKDNQITWHCVDKAKKTGISGFFQTQARASDGFDRLRLVGLSKTRSYQVETRPQRLYIKRFGGLVKHIMPIIRNPEGFLLRTANRFYALTDCVETYTAYGETLMNGILLNNQFMGSYYNPQTRLLGDYGSQLYTIQTV